MPSASRMTTPVTVDEAQARRQAGPDTSAAVAKLIRFLETGSAPGQPVTALDLAGAGHGVAVESGLGEVLDTQALKAYRQRLRDLEQELSQAEDWSDIGRLDSLHAERDALLDELARATGLGGRARATGSSQERARVAVKKAISAATGRIATVSEPLARHLETGIHTGLNCSYEPGPEDNQDWVLD